MATKKTAPKKATPAKKVASVKRGSSGDSDAAKAAGKAAQQMGKANNVNPLGGYEKFTVRPTATSPNTNTYSIYVKDSRLNRPYYEAISEGTDSAAGFYLSRTRLLKMLPKSSLPGFKGSKTPPPTGKMKKK